MLCYDEEVWRTTWTYMLWYLILLWFWRNGAVCGYLNFLFVGILNIIVSKALFCLGASWFCIFVACCTCPFGEVTFFSMPNLRIMKGKKSGFQKLYTTSLILPCGLISNSHYMIHGILLSTMAGLRYGNNLLICLTLMENKMPIRYVNEACNSVK